MKQFFDAVWWWIRLAALLVVAVYLISLLAMNAGQKAELWYWFGRDAAPSSIISLVLVSFLSGGVVFTTGWAMFKALLKYRRTRAERRERAERERQQEMQRKASMLRTKPAPTPMLRKPIVPPVPRGTFSDAGDDASADLPPVDPRDAETRAAPIDIHAVPTDLRPSVTPARPVAVAGSSVASDARPTGSAATSTGAEKRGPTVAAPMPVPGANRPIDATPAFDAVAVEPDESPTPLVKTAIAADAGRSPLPPASPPPAGG